MKETDFFARWGWALLLVIVSLGQDGVLWSALRLLTPLVRPLLWSGVLAMVLYSPLCLLERNLPIRSAGIRRAAALALVLTGFLACMLLLLVLLLPRLGQTVMQLVENLPQMRLNLYAWLYRVLARWPAALDWLEKAQEMPGIQERLTQDLSPLLSGTADAAAAMGSAAANFGIGLILAGYFLACRDTLARQADCFLRAWLPAKTARGLIELGRLVRCAFTGFLTGQCLESCILGILFAVLLSICHMPYALLISVIVAGTAIVPVLGSLVGCAVGTVLILAVAPGRAFWFILLFLCMQQLEGALIYPRVVGQSVGLPPLWIFLAVLAGGRLYGILGILLFVPLGSVVYTLLRRQTVRRIRRKDLEDCGSENKSFE